MGLAHGAVDIERGRQLRRPLSSFSEPNRSGLFLAHVGMMLALHGAVPIPEYDASNVKHWGRRKLKRDE